MVREMQSGFERQNPDCIRFNIFVIINQSVSNYFQLINTAILEEKISSGAFPFTQQLFWDTDLTNINLRTHYRYIIERVLIRGFLEDFYILTRLYKTEEIKDALRKSKELDAKTVQFCSHYFNLPQSEMYVSSYYS